MKKRTMALLLAGVMCTAAFAGCGSSSSSSSSDSSSSSSDSTAASEGETWLIGYANRDDTDTYLKAVMDAFVDLVEADDRFEVIVADAGGDAQKQVEDLDNFIVQGINCAVLVPQDGDTVVDYVNDFNDDGIPVFCSSQSATDGDFTFVGASDYDMGYYTARWAYENLPEGSKILYLGGNMGYQTSIDRRQGLIDALAERLYADADGNVLNEDGDLEVLSWQECMYTMEDGMTIAEDWIQTFSDFDCIIACNDRSALGALEALQGAGIEGVYVCGIDGLEDAMQAVADGTMACTVLQSYEAQAQALFYAFETAYEGGENPETINPDVITIDASNVEEYM